MAELTQAPGSDSNNASDPEMLNMLPVEYQAPGVEEAKPNIVDRTIQKVEDATNAVIGK